MENMKKALMYLGFSWFYGLIIVNQAPTSLGNQCYNDLIVRIYKLYAHWIWWICEIKESNISAVNILCFHHAQLGLSA